MHGLPWFAMIAVAVLAGSNALPPQRNASIGKLVVGTQNVLLKGKPVKRATIAHSCARLMMHMVCMKQTRRFNAYRVGSTAGITC